MGAWWLVLVKGSASEPMRAAFERKKGTALAFG
jgi:hypothetical protein